MAFERAPEDQFHKVLGGFGVAEGGVGGDEGEGGGDGGEYAAEKDGCEGDLFAKFEAHGLYPWERDKDEQDSGDNVQRPHHRKHSIPCLERSLIKKLRISLIFTRIDHRSDGSYQSRASSENHHKPCHCSEFSAADCRDIEKCYAEFEGNLVEPMQAARYPGETEEVGVDCVESSSGGSSVAEFWDC